jgi:uncharacterized membrane protein YqjE
MSLYSLPRPEFRQSIPDLIRQLFSEMTELIQQHIELTKLEIREESKRIAKAAVFGVMGLVFAQVGLIFLGYLLVEALDRTMSRVGATAITLVLFLVIAGVLVGLCVQQLKSAKDLLKQPPANQ